MRKLSIWKVTRRMRGTRVVLVLTLAAPLPATAQAVDSAIARVTSNLRTQIEVAGRPAPETYTLAERMARYHVPGISIAVADSGRIVWARGFGVKEAGETDSVTATTLFQAASISKPVAATAMLRMVAAGKLDLDRPVNDYLKSWKVPQNKYNARQKVTLRRIVSHSAGLTVHGFPGYAAGAPVPTVVQVLDGTPPANTAPVRVDTTPGAIFRYSGGGVTVEQLVLSDVSGDTFPALMKRLVLDPIGMSHSTYRQPLPAELASQAAVAHDAQGKPIAGRWHTYPEMAAAGLWTTPTDLLKWALAIAAARAGEAGAILPQTLAAEMLTVQKGSMGLGPVLGGTGDGFHFGHGGSNAGYRCQVIYFPVLGKGAAIMTNGDDGGALAREVLLAIGAEYGWPDYSVVRTAQLDPARLDRYVGRYAVARPAGIMYIIARKGDRLFLQPPGMLGGDELVMTAPDRGVSLRSGEWVTFPAGDGPAPFLVAMSDTLRRASVDAAGLADYAGTYEVKTPGRPTLEVRVTVEDGLAVAQVVGRRARLPLVPESGDTFWAQGVRITFQRDAAGHVTAVTILQNGQTMTGTRVP
ncbi:MAG: serine hydrolase [Gemmatimonadota bacterium]